MKRSEMAQEILKAMDSLPNGSLMIDMAYRILEAIEDKGMLPPVDKSCSENYLCNIWEKENE
jgi:hypothetical protein